MFVGLSFYEDSLGVLPHVDFFEIAFGHASVGDVRHPASGLANRRLTVFTVKQ